MLDIYHQLKAPNTYICVFTAIVAYASVFYIGFSSSVAVAQTDLSQTMSTFYEVKPRSLKQVSNELEVQIRADDDALYFQITVKKPDDYVYRAQENDNEFENEHVQIYLVPNENERSAFVFGINHQNAHFYGVVNESSELNLDWVGQ